MVKILIYLLNIWAKKTLSLVDTFSNINKFSYPLKK